MFASDLDHNGCPPLHPKLFSWEDAVSFRVEAEQLGACFDDLEIHFLEGDQLSIKGKRKDDDNPVIAWICRKRFVADFARTFKLSCSVEVDSVKATLTDGVLEIRLPKAAVDQPQKIELGTGA